MAKKSVRRSREREEGKKNDKILFAFLATFLSIIGFVIALIMKREDKYVMFYAKQSLVVFIVGAVGGVIGSLFNFIPIIGAIIHFALGVIVVLLWALSWVYALSGEMKEVPVIGAWIRGIRL